MNAVSTLQTYTVPERFEKALKSIRNALRGVDLDIVEEFAAGKADSFKILLISSPVLDFEAIALSRASAVFFPLHVMVWEDGDSTQVSLVNPASLFEARLPVGAAHPMNRLVTLVELALESLLEGVERSWN